MRTSTAALAAAITTITPAAALAATQDPETAVPTTAPASAVRPAFAGHASVSDQMTRAGDRYARHRRLVSRHLRLAHEVADLRGRSLEHGHEARVRRWSEARLRRANARLRAEARSLRPVPSSTATRGATSVSGSGGAGGQLASIRACESGGNYATNTGNGFYGAYQFTQATWESVGGAGNPAMASPAEQDARAAALLASSGSSPWPVCGG